jgi:hypothetical protein
LIRWYFTLALIEGLIVLIVLLFLPGKPLSSSFVGWSIGRLLSLSFGLLLNVVLFWIVFNLWRRSSWIDRYIQRLVSALDQDKVYWSVIFLVALLFVISIYYLQIDSRNLEETQGSYNKLIAWSILFFRYSLIHLAPFAVWTIFLCLQTWLTVRMLHYGTSLRVFTAYRKTFIALSVVFGLLFLLSIWIIRTGLGLLPDNVGWGAPGVPILPTQVFLATLISLVSYAIFTFSVYIFKQRLADSHDFRLPAGTMDVIICVLLWMAAVWLWTAEPLQTTWFSPTPVPPNFEYYPHSDAANFDIPAHSLLIGNGLEKGVVRPFYSFLLALIQAFNGLGYQKVIEWQILVLATIPALLYLITKTIHHRISGVTIGLLAIYHEVNSISLSGSIDVSHSKLIMSDLPTTLGVILISLMVIFWLRKPDRRMVFPLITGGILVLTMLIRIQVAILLPAVLITSWLVLYRHPKMWLKSMSLLALGSLLILLPWLWRNWQISGEIAFSEAAQTSQAGLIGMRYSLSPDQENNYQRNNESDSEYLSRMAGGAAQFVYEHPLEAARFITAHFLHNQISTIMVIPTYFSLSDNSLKFLSKLHIGRLSTPFEVWKRCCSLSKYVAKFGYWKKWNGALARESMLPLLTSLFFISIGLVISWYRFRFIGLFPLFVNLSYSLSNALVRTSGWRFNLPVDWVGMMYYGIGLIQIFFWLVMFFGNRIFPSKATLPVYDRSVRLEDKRIPWKKIASAGLILFLISASIPITERFIPDRYQDHDVQVVLSNLIEQGSSSSSEINSGILQDFLRQTNAVALFGRGLYPRFYPSGQGHPDPNWPSYKPREYDRLGFILLGPQRESVLFRTQKPPAYFPNAADILVVGCNQKDYIVAHLIVFLDSSNEELMRSPPENWVCP